MAACVVDRILALAHVSERDVVYDLGCGDGRIVIAAARRYGARGVCMAGDSIAFTIADTVGGHRARWRLRGRISSGRMSGAATADGGTEAATGTWQAARP